MIPGKRLTAAFTFVTGLLLGSAGTALYNDAQKQQDAFPQATEMPETIVLSLGTVQAYSRDNVPVEARVSIAGFAPQNIDTENRMRAAVIQHIKTHIGGQTTKELGVEQRLNEIKTQFMTETDRNFSEVRLELPQVYADAIARDALSTVRLLAQGKAESDAAVRLSLEVSFDTQTIERYYANQARKSAQAQTPKTP